MTKLTKEIASEVEFKMNENQKLHLVNDIVYSQLTSPKHTKFTVDFLKGIGEVAEEENQSDVVEAVKKVIKFIKEIQ
jgi:hypothetical protein